MLQTRYMPEPLQSQLDADMSMLRVNPSTAVAWRWIAYVWRAPNAVGVGRCIVLYRTLSCTGHVLGSRRTRAICYLEQS
jgi:hypothetical protein